jgi:branched-chain amino acid transport system ATP-binding protein
VTEVLRTERLSVRYGGVQALSEVDLIVDAGQLVGLIGPNGAGKTTFIDAIAGFAPSTGRVWLAGAEVSSLVPHHRARRGLARTWQAADLFDDLTVRENLCVASGRPSLGLVVRELLTAREGARASVDRELELFGLASIADHSADQLTQGQRKLVGVARALAAQPALLCLDEPAAGLDTSESQALGRHLHEIAGGGTAVLLVDHDMGLVLSVCDHVVVLDFGRVIARGTPDEIRRDPDVVEAYLGRAAEQVAAPSPSAAAPGAKPPGGETPWA